MPEALVPWQVAQFASNKALPLAANADSSGSVTSTITDRCAGPEEDIFQNAAAAMITAAAPRTNL